MKLKQFIQELEKISKQLDNNIDDVDVLMADYIPVVKPVLKDNIVFITDTDRHHTKLSKIFPK